VCGESELKTPVVRWLHLPRGGRNSAPVTVVPAVEGAQEKERQDETEFTTKISSKKTSLVLVS
jgi:hypothetical protein